jgi:hypothetical protein
LLALVAHKDPAIALLDIPGIERTKGRRANRFAGTQIEAGMMPGTSDGTVNDQAVHERAMVVTAMRPYREDLRSLAHQQNLVVTDMADQLVILEGAGVDALRQIGSARLRLFVSHPQILPWARHRGARHRARRPVHT